MTHPYTAEKPPLPESSDELRRRIPGWGADLNLEDRPAVPRLQDAPGIGAVPWDEPEQQEERRPRERSIEHARLTPVFGTSCPTRGLSGVVRRFSYDRYSEGRAAHWLLLLGADRIDAMESHLRSFATTRPDNPLTQTGVVRGELGHHPISSRVGQHRADRYHQWMDPVIVAGPWLAFGYLAIRSTRRLRRRRARAGVR